MARESYYQFSVYFDDSKEKDKDILTLKNKIEREQLNTAIIKNQFLDFQMTLSQKFPKMISTPELNHWKQTIRAPAQDSGFELSSEIMAKGKQLFLEKQYSQASVEFSKLIEQFPVSSSIVEAHFLQAESYYLEGKYDSALDVIDQMMSRFPENELTGYIMLRFAQILKATKHEIEAAEVYHTIIIHFGNIPQLKKQAADMLSLIEKTNK